MSAFGFLSPLGKISKMVGGLLGTTGGSAVAKILRAAIHGAIPSLDPPTLDAIEYAIWLAITGGAIYVAPPNTKP